MAGSIPPVEESLSIIVSSGMSSGMPSSSVPASEAVGLGKLWVPSGFIVASSAIVAVISESVGCGC